MKKIKEIFLRFILRFNPKFWGLVYPYNEQWDKDLNFLMDNAEDISFDERNIIDNDHYTIIFTINHFKVSVWIKNYPYGYGRPYLVNVYDCCYRPSKLTIKKLRNLEMQMIKNKSIN